MRHRIYRVPSSQTLFISNFLNSGLMRKLSVPKKNTDSVRRLQSSGSEFIVIVHVFFCKKLRF